MNPQDLFISYSHADRAFATQLASLLTKEGLNIWIDVKDIPPGENWRNAIDEGLETASVMLLIVSPESMASAEVQAEWNYFLDEKKQIIPIILRPAALPSRLRLIQRIDFSQSGGHFLENYALLRDRLKNASIQLTPSIDGSTYTIKKMESHDRSANRTQIMVALIGAAAVIIAAAIGLVPILLDQINTPTNTVPVPSITTTPAQATLPPTVVTAPTQSSQPTETPDQAALTVHKEDYDLTLIYNGADSFIIQANAPTLLTGFAIRTTKETVTLTDYFADLSINNFSLQSGDCLVFERAGEAPPRPQSCQRSFPHQVVPGQTFWYDNNTNRARDLVLELNGNNLGICSAQGGAGTCEYHK